MKDCIIISNFLSINVFFLLPQVIEYLNKTSFLPSEKEKVDTLAKVQELVIHFDRTLLDAFYEEIVAFQNDRNADVRKFVVGFIEEAW